MNNIISKVVGAVVTLGICIFVFAGVLLAVGEYTTDKYSVEKDIRLISVIEEKYTTEYVRSAAFRSEFNRHHEANCEVGLVENKYDFTDMVCPTAPKKIVLRDYLNDKYSGLYDRIDERNNSKDGWKWFGKEFH